LNIQYQFGALQASIQFADIALEFGVASLQRLVFTLARRTFAQHARVEISTIALRTPCRKERRVNAFAPQESTKGSRRACICCIENSSLFLNRETPALGEFGNLGAARRSCR